MLFGYYALLNAGIFGISWFKAWRWLNLIGFGFTFGIGSTWGFFRYRPEDFNTTEPFLILFFCFYLTISILFAHRQPPRLRGYVDSALVFGLPIVVFALQAGLVRNMTYGLAFSALTLSAVYIGVSLLLWRRRTPGMRLLTEAFLALAVVFGSVAIPLAMDGRWTASAWALEGAAIIWIGVRQRRTLARHFGVLIQIGAGLSLVMDMGPASRNIPVMNGICMGAVAVSLAGLFSSWYLDSNREIIRKWERWFAVPLMIWGLIFWAGAGLREIDGHVPASHRKSAALLFFAASFGIMAAVSRRLKWRTLSYPVMGMIPAYWAVALIESIDHPRSHLFKGWAIFPWLLVFTVHFGALKGFETIWNPRIVRLWHALGGLLAVFVATRECDWLIRQISGLGPVWDLVIWCWLPGLVILAIQRSGERRIWPLFDFKDVYRVWLCGMILVFIMFWELGACLQAGDPRPLPYLPLLNPLDISQAFGCLLVYLWVQSTAQDRFTAMSPATTRKVLLCAAGVAFLWINAAVARAVHFYGGVPFTGDALFDSVLFQAALSLLWAALAFAIMTMAVKRGRRPVWIAGAGLLSLVVIKLFLVDLSGTGTVARIVSFIGVGCLMLLLGYVAPIPPRRADEQIQGG